MKRLVLLFALLLAALPAQASPIVADISTYHIAIDTSFTGIRLFIFGARNETGDVVVIIRGPATNFVIRKKESVGGIWINRERVAFDAVPDFYALASSRPLDALQAWPLLYRLGIGIGSLIVTPNSNHDRALFPEFSSAFLRYQQKHHLYNDGVSLGFMGETLFKATIPFPDNIPKGNYTAEIYLISDGELVGMQAMPIRVEKTGFDAFVYELSRRYAALYGALAIMLALAAGWLAGKIFERK